MAAAPCKGVRNTADGDRRKRSSAAEIARALGISQRKVEQIQTITAFATAYPDIRQAIEENRLSINAAYREVQRRRRPQTPVEPPDDTKVDCLLFRAMETLDRDQLKRLIGLLQECVRTMPGRP